jgi:hypothetical protein
MEVWTHNTCILSSLCFKFKLVSFDACALSQCAVSGGAWRPTSKEAPIGMTSLFGCRFSEREERGIREERPTKGGVVAVAGGLGVGEDCPVSKDARGQGVCWGQRTGAWELAWRGAAIGIHAVRRRGLGTMASPIDGWAPVVCERERR